MVQRTKSEPPARGSRPPGAAGVTPGAVIDDRYRILSHLGEGGMGTVLVAEHVELGRRVALKVLQEQVGDDPSMRKRFQREAKTLAAMSHPNIVALNDYGIWQGTPYLVMELLEGRTLRDLLDAEPLLPIERALAITQQVLRALSYAHGHGVIHRDLKPGNVFLQALPDQIDHVKLLDFGFAKFVGQPSTSFVSADGIVVGTPAYMAPEQAGGMVDHRADVYAAGVLLFEMLAGQRPFEGSPLEMIRARMSRDAPPLGSLRSQLHEPELEQAIARALARRPEDRHPTAAAMSSALTALGATVSAPPAAPAKRAAVAPPGSDTEELSSSDLERPADPASRTGRERGVSPLWFVLATLSMSGLAFAAWRSSPLGADVPIDPAAWLAFARSPGAESAPAAGTETDAEAEAEAEAEAQTEAQTQTEAQAEAGPEESEVQAATSTETASEATATPDTPAEIAAVAVAGADAPIPEMPALVPLEAAVERALDPVEPLASPSEPAPPEPVVAAPPAAGPADPWAREVPADLLALRARIDRAALPSAADLQRVGSYARRASGDARALTLLAHGYVRVRWMTEALDRYAEAHALDHEVRGDPWMRADLIELSASAVVGARASELVIAIYGREALGAIDARLALGGLDAAGAERLRALRDAIAVLP